jgi:mono/diheme cytochrome c family protein
MNLRTIILALVGLVVAGFVTLVLAGRITWFSEQRPVEFLDDMDHQFKAIPQQQSTFFSDRRTQRDPVEGTIARGDQPYALTQGDIDLAETQNVNPGLPDDPIVLARGQNRFNVYCSPCHNYNGKSGTAVTTRGQWAGIPELTRPETAALSDARIFHIISAGQNLMPSYADKISATDRWAVIKYLRTLQAAAAQQ